MTRLRLKVVLAVVAGHGLVYAATAYGQSAATIHAMAEAESNPAKSVQLLCQAADLAPTNQSYRSDCNTGRTSLLAGDQRLLKNAQDEYEAGYKPKAKHDAKLVTTLDPNLYKQAQDLIAKIDGGGGNGNNTDAQKALLSQAESLYQSGNLQSAKTTAQGVTDPSLKDAAAKIVSDVDHYNRLVEAGKSQELAKDYAKAQTSYTEALANYPHVGNDDLKSALQRVQLAATNPGTHKGDDAHTHLAPPPPPPPPESSADKVKRLLVEATSAMTRSDYDKATKRFNDVLSIDSSNADAKKGLNQINATLSAALSKDPARLEKTLREAIVAYYASHFEDAESRFNRYLGADGGKKKGAAYFYLGATEATLAMLDDAPKRAARNRQAQEDFKQAREAGYQPIETLVSSRVLGVWKSSGM